MNGKFFFKSALLLFFCCGVGFRTFAQIDSLLNVMDKEYPQEKIYIHYDRPYYNTGETIWFKAYLFSANLPSFISKTMYAELIDEKGEVLERKTLPIFSASASGDFALPDTLRSSLLYVRAYTPWMLNFDSSFLYLKPIRIIASQPRNERVARKEPVYALHLFPEGGDLVEGLESRVAFKGVDDQGFPISVKGDIVDSKKQKVASFTSLHDGMGHFAISPAANEKYKAVWKDPKGVSHETDLPAAKKSGVVLSVINNGNEISYGIARSENLPADQRAFQVVAHMHQVPVYVARVNMSTRAKVMAPIALTDVPDGIMQVTLFTDKGQPLAERIVFANQNNYYFITDLHANEKNFGRKAKNVIQLDVGDTIISNVSVSITDAGTITATREEENIFSHILLTSDIKGYVHNPAYYFSGSADSIQAHLDLVMMTNGWRRFKWEDVIAGKLPVIKNIPQPYVTVNGQVLGLRSGDLVNKDLSLILETKKNNSQFLMVPVSPKGEFVVNNLVFYDTAKLYYQFNNDKDKRLTSIASFNFRNTFLNFPGKPVRDLLPYLKPVIPDSSALKKNEAMAKARREEFFEGIKVKELAGVEVTARQKSSAQKLDEEYTSGLFTGGDGYTFAVEEDPFAASSMSVLDYLQGKVAGLQISNTGPGGGNLSWRGGTPALFLNEMITDVGLIQSTPMSNVALIKVFRPPFIGATGGGAGGAIAIYTKKGASRNSDVKGLSFTSVVGYSPPKEFYSPDYSSPLADRNKSDYRATLYWNPYVIFDKSTRRIMIPFYNNDNCKKIRVVIEGINGEGKLTREEKFFE